MRYLIASMLMCCCAAAGYSQEDTGASDAPVVTTDEGSGDVAVGVESKKDDKPAGGGCGCSGKPKL